MTLKRMIVHAAFSAALATGSLISATATAEGWGMPSLNPFAKKSKAPTSARVSDSDSSFSLLPKWGTSSPKKRSSGPSTWSRMTNAINPWGSSAPANPEPSPTGSFNPFATASAKKKQADDDSSFLPSWLGGGTPVDDEPKSVNDFLKQDTLDIP